VVASDVERNRDMKMKGKTKTLCDVCLYKVGSNCRLYICGSLLQQRLS